MGLDPRFLASSGREVFTGNELLVKGALETPRGVNLMTGYPGSPVAGFFDALSDIAPLLQKKGIRAFQANNEALGVAALNGSQMGPFRGIVAFKSVGTQVGSDALALGNLAGAHPEGGALVISGEDPWCDSTQVPADSRFLFEHLRMAVVEPGDIQELKDWVAKCFELSRAAGLYMGYIVTVAHADAGGTVDVYPNHFPEVNMNARIQMTTSEIPLEKNVLLPPRTWKREMGIPERFALTIAKARELGINRIQPATAHNGVAPLGFIVTGMGGPYLDQVLADIDLTGQFPILRMGLSYPPDVKMVAEFSALCKHMIVIEERRSFLEKGIRDAAFRLLPPDVAGDISSRLFGKSFPGRSTDGSPLPGIPDVRGLNPSVLAQAIIPLIKSTEEIPPQLRNGKLSAELDLIRRASKPKLQIFNDRVIARTPTFCPGCPHRDSSAVLLEIRKNLADPDYMKRVHKRAPVDLVAHGDTGCYTMLMFAPTEQLMHNYSGMGLGGGTGSGIDPFITNKQIVFMGDGTFFHSGQVAISNAIKAGQDICFIILENGTTAMTGHQEHPGTEIDLLGNRSFIQDIEAVCKSMKGTSPLTVIKLDPADRDRYHKTLEKTLLADGVKVVIADKECGITYHRRKGREERNQIKKHGFLPEKAHMNVTPEVCENCLECTKATACPGLITAETDYGKKIDTDLTWCVNDGACERVTTSNNYGTSVKPCPSFEQIIVKKSKRNRYLLPNMDLAKLPEPAHVHNMTAPGATWRAHLAGVGGMGIGVVGALVVRAGHKEGYRVVFQDKKGLAIRNGGVYGQITFIREQQSASEEAPAAPLRPSTNAGWIPYGKADLLLGVDVLEAARATDPRELFRVASKERTAAVLNLHKQPTVYTLLGKQDFDVDALREEIYNSCREDLSYAKNISEICEQRLGSKQFVNIMMLGVAFQLGLVPVSLSSIAWAIKDTIRRDHRRNLKAFNIGRKLAFEPRVLPPKPEPVTWQQLVTNKQRIIRKSRLIGGEALSAKFERLVRTSVEAMSALDTQLKYDMALRIYDLMMWDNLDYARRYVDVVKQVYKQDSAERNFAATKAIIWNAAKLMLIKDEPYVAYLLTRLEKKQRDIAKYGVDTANGDRIIYRHHTSPEFPIGKRRIRLRITTTDWQLKIVAKMKWLRKLPGWHKREVEFREWYLGLLRQLRFTNSAEYAQAVAVLNSPQDVTGYREVRYPKMDAAKAFVADQLRQKTAIPMDDAPLLMPSTTISAK